MTAAIRAAILMLASIVMGGFFGLNMAQQRSVPQLQSDFEHQRENLQDLISQSRAQHERLDDRIMRMEQRLSTIEGVGIGLGSLIVLLEFAQFITRKKV